MAVIDDATTEQAKKIKELKAIDINDTSLPEGKEETINPNADAWERACPPPDGTYLVKLHEARQCYMKGETDDGDIYYVANLEAKIQENEEWKDVTVFGKVSTYIGAGKEISTMAGLIRKFGVNVSPQVTHLALIKLLKKCLAKEPKIYLEGEWKAWDTHANSWIKQGMKNFPRTEDGKGYHHVVTDSKGGSVTAKLKPTKWWGLKEYREYMEKQKAKIAQQRANQQAQQAQGGKANGAEVVGNFTEIGGGAPPATATASATTSRAVPDDDFVIDE